MDARGKAVGAGRGHDAGRRGCRPPTTPFIPCQAFAGRSGLLKDGPAARRDAAARQRRRQLAALHLLVVDHHELARRDDGFERAVAAQRGAVVVGHIQHHRRDLAPRRFRLGVYRSPPGWMYRRWMYGEYLPPAFWARSFWITSFWLYGLDRPPLGCEWVRYGSDALLIDVATGEILQVVYNAFY